MRKQRYSGFAQFPDAEKRDKFVGVLSTGDAALAGRAYLSGSRPTILFENLTAREQKKVVSALEGLGHWYEDVQFETME